MTKIIKGKLFPISEYWLFGLSNKIIIDDELIPKHISDLLSNLPVEASRREERITKRSQILELLTPILKQHGYDVIFEDGAIWINVDERDFLFEKLKVPKNHLNNYRLDKIRKL